MISWRTQRGAASLAVTLLLLFSVTLAVFFANRSLIFEQKTSANQLRATVAFEAAEAGLEWAIAQINDPPVLQAAPSCAPATSNFSTSVSFRERYIVPTAGTNATPNGSFVPPADSRAACSIAANGALTCACPNPGTAPVLGAADRPRFMVEFRAAAGDPLAVEIVSRGCTSSDPFCSDAGTARADAISVSRVSLKLVPTFGNAPAAALTTGSATVTSGNLSVVNTDIPSNGITINAGTTVNQGGGTNVATIPGTPPSASILDNDYSLSALTSADATGDLFFQSFFGKSIAAYKADPRTVVVTAANCGTANACGSYVSSKYNEGYQQFWIEPDVQFTNANLPAVGTLGTQNKPIFLAGSGEVELKSNLVAYGMFYASTAAANENWDYDGSGSGTVFGAFVSRGNFDKGSGTLNIVYDGRIFGAGGIPSGLLVRVPGSWRDRDGVY